MVNEKFSGSTCPEGQFLRYAPERAEVYNFIQERLNAERGDERHVYIDEFKRRKADNLFVTRIEKLNNKLENDAGYGENLAKARSMVFEAIVTYLGSNEQWFGPETFVNDVSYADDSFGKIDALVESPVGVCGIDLVSTNNINTIISKVTKNLGLMTNGLPETIEAYTNGEVAGQFAFLPLTIGLNPRNTDQLINTVASEVTEKRGGEFQGFTGTEDNIIEKRGPYMMAFTEQILIQLRRYLELTQEGKLIFPDMTKEEAIKDLAGMIKYYEYFMESLRNKGITIIPDNTNLYISEAVKQI